MAKKRPTPFDPKRSPISSTTLARQVAKQHSTILNNALWVSENSYNLLQTSYSQIPVPTSPTAHGAFGSESLWKGAVDEQRLWVRQHVLVSGASLLEDYLSSAIRAALWSNPTMADRSLASIREIDLIKFGDRAPGLDKLIDRKAKSVLKGEWASRLRELSITFGKLPPKFKTLAIKLQDLQDKRNKIAHSFGRSSKAHRRTPWESSTLIKLEVSEVEEYLRCIGQTIREADANLFAPLIGGYEFLCEYHLWLTAQTDAFTRPSPDKLEPAFRKHIQQKFGSGPDKKYYLALILYYDKCR
jgi:hypothetical protein